jgi:hypothetical protein
MTQQNPLQKYYRQPAIYINLPTKGRYYSADVYAPTATGEIPVLPMTARDELSFRTPDAMMSGQATVDVIRSCMPNVLDPWQLVNYDIDIILLALRIATYGETMDITAVVPVVNESMTQSVNLPALLDTVRNIAIDDNAVTKQGFRIKFNPLTYKEITQSQLLAFEQQKTMSSVNASQMSEEEKNKRFTESFKKLTDVNWSILQDSIQQITTPDGVVVSDKEQINDFLSNCNSKIVLEIQEELGRVRNQANFKPLKFKSTEEQIKRGAPVSFDVPLTFDSSNFFG